MRPGTRLIVLHPSLHKQGLSALPAASHHILVLVFDVSSHSLILFALLFSGKDAVPGTGTDASAASRTQSPPSLIDELLHYASIKLVFSGRLQLVVIQCDEGYA
ncbi:unnamed protein product [Cuscuta europaea]|uniref:Uncharacterized protein n=1 Tax=Cuscuta europaea TaxID=41803 RepID=A0A9P1DW36_CUSEU|nr:unnamed protein product [Cuscuta europaea]